MSIVNIRGTLNQNEINYASANFKQAFNKHTNFMLRTYVRSYYIEQSKLALSFCSCFLKLPKSHCIESCIQGNMRTYYVYI